MLQSVRSDTSDFAAMVAALTAADLPVSDLGEGAQYFSNGAAYGGLALFGSIGLLRSMVAIERGKGSGSALLAALVEKARDLGARELWLLTTSAEAFFARHGFVRKDRAEAPEAIAATSQFKDLCPASAALMHKRIA